MAGAGATAGSAKRRRGPVRGPEGVRPRKKFTPSGLLALKAEAFGEEFETKGPMASLELHGSVAVVGIDGPLLQHPNPDWDDYDSIQARAEVAFRSAEVVAVGLRINSPGGDAPGCIELARALRSLADDTKKPLAVFIDGTAASAAYAIAAAATAGIFAAPTSTVGSIACYRTNVDLTAVDRALGVKMTFIASDDADLKLAGNPHVAMTEVVEAHEREKVNIITGLFYDLVSEMRGVTREQLVALRGGAFLGVQGPEKGLIDGLREYAAFLSDLQTPQGRKLMATPKIPAASTLMKASDKEWEALRTLSESDDEEKRKMAKSLLKKMMGDEEKAGDVTPPKKDEEDKEVQEKAALAAKAEEEKKKEGEAKAAQALATAGTLAVASELQTVKAELAEEKKARLASEKRALEAQLEGEKTKLLASRADFSDALRATLAKLPLEEIQKAVKDLPRVSATPMSSVRALQTQPRKGKAGPAAAGAGLSEAQEKVLARIRGGGAPQAAVEHNEDGTLELHPISPEAAQARLEELDAELAAAAGQ